MKRIGEDAIRLPYKIKEIWLWDAKKPFDIRSAWIDLLLLASSEKKEVFLKNEVFLIERGELITSERNLADRWGWSKTKVRHFLELLSHKKMIVTKTPGKMGTSIFILDYGQYQTYVVEQKTIPKDKKGCNSRSSPIPYKSIINHLNMRIGSNYRDTTKKTRKLIKTRWNEGFNEDDFYTVIDKKCLEWINTDMEKYLRPITLFGPKFESYLNQLTIKTVGNAKEQMLKKLYQDALNEERDE